MPSSRHLHFDPLGGIAGDMFVAAMLDLMPDMEGKARAVVSALLGSEATFELSRAPVSGFAGASLRVVCQPGSHHRHLSDIVAMIEACEPLPTDARRIALDIFTRLAQAEAKVHEKSVETIHFHEVGAADSVLDIALAGLLIDAAGATSVSMGSVPLGGGTVRTEHGVMPVPAPATALLLQGFTIHDDGIAGERVTPTGAAILNHLREIACDRCAEGQLGAMAMGFGTRTLPGMPNVLRILEIVPATRHSDDMIVTAFEIDDQTAEDLAYGLDRLRMIDGVRDVLQIPCLGKKGRMVASIQVLAEPSAQGAVRDMIFSQTTTLGLREQRVSRHILSRNIESKQGVRVKTVQRGSTVTRKAEFDDIAHDDGDHAARQVLRNKVEANE